MRKALIAVDLLFVALFGVPVRGEPLSAVAQVAEDRRSNGIEEPIPGEDLSCSLVNRAVQRAYNSSRYSLQEYEL